MLLSNWLKEHALTRKDFAGQIGVSPSYITALCSRTVWPGKDVANRIVEATGGDVTADDFLNDVEAPDETEKGAA